MMRCGARFLHQPEPTNSCQDVTHICAMRTIVPLVSGVLFCADLYWNKLFCWFIDHNKLERHEIENSRVAKFNHGILPLVYIPRDVGYQRPQALSLLALVSGDNRHNGGEFPQLSSMFLTKLPTELRQKIWREC